MLLPPPLISDADGSRARPFWSVMIPTYNARADYLEETLRSVLRQDPGPEQMQIEVLDDWHARITVRNLIVCPAIAVRRRVYEQLGGFLPRLHYVPDWEMWQRIASQFSFWFEPSILACYRVHSNSATSRMRRDAADVREVREVIDLTTAYHSPGSGR